MYLYFYWQFFVLFLIFGYKLFGVFFSGLLLLLVTQGHLFEMGSHVNVLIDWIINKCYFQNY